LQRHNPFTHSRVCALCAVSVCLCVVCLCLCVCVSSCLFAPRSNAPVCSHSPQRVLDSLSNTAALNTCSRAQARGDSASGTRTEVQPPSRAAAAKPERACDRVQAHSVRTPESATIYTHMHMHMHAHNHTLQTHSLTHAHTHARA